jgi:hypothetical protein
MPGAPTGHRKLKGFFVTLDETGSWFGRMSEALRNCSTSESYRARGGFEEIAVLRNVAAGLEPWMFGRANSGLVCRTGPGCQSQWNAVGRAPSGAAHYRYYQQPSGSVFVLPDRTWVYAMGSCEFRLANAFAANAAAPPNADVEPSAVIAQWVQPREDGWSELADWVAPFAGAESITGAVTATFAPEGAEVPSLVRWLLPDAARAATGAADFRALVDAQLARSGAPSARRRSDRMPTITAEGASIALRGWVSREAVAAYVG